MCFLFLCPSFLISCVVETWLFFCLFSTSCSFHLLPFTDMSGSSSWRLLLLLNLLGTNKLDCMVVLLQFKPFFAPVTITWLDVHQPITTELWDVLRSSIFNLKQKSPDHLEAPDELTKDHMPGSHSPTMHLASPLASRRLPECHSRMAKKRSNKKF